MPAESIDEIGHQRREEDRGSILGRVENSRCGPPYGRRKPGRHNSTVCGKRWCFRRPNHKTQTEQSGNGRCSGEEADKTLQHREKRPEENAEGIDQSGTIAVQKPASRQLSDDVSPAECREDVSHMNSIEAKFFSHCWTSNRYCRAVSIIDCRD